jgi:methylsterol monooxygenase
MLIPITLSILVISTLIGSIYSYIVLRTSALAPYKVQPQKHKKNVFKTHFPLIAFNLFSLIAITGISLYFTQTAFDQNLPTFWTFWLQLFIVMAFDDTFFYFFHRAMHQNPFLFKHIHSIHHKASPPFPLDFIYVHPLEWLLGSTGLTIGLVVVYGLFGTINVYPFWFYAAFRNLHEIEIHSNTRSWIAQYVPFWGTTEHHDYHHSRLNGNYASSFTLWDKVFKTEIVHPENRNDESL